MSASVGSAGEVTGEALLNTTILGSITARGLVASPGNNSLIINCPNILVRAGEEISLGTGNPANSRVTSTVSGYLA